MLQISQIELPTNFKPHLIAAHPTRPVFAVSANFTIFVYENQDLLFEFNCEGIPVALGFTQNKLTVACLGGEVITLHYENQLVLSRKQYDDRIIAILEDSIITQSAAIGEHTEIPLPGSIIAACDYMDGQLVLDESGQLHSLKGNNLEVKLRVEEEPIGIESRAELLVVGCRRKFLFLNEKFEVTREISVESDVCCFSVSDNGFICYLDKEGKLVAVQ